MRLILMFKKCILSYLSFENLQLNNEPMGPILGWKGGGDSDFSNSNRPKIYNVFDYLDILFLRCCLLYCRGWQLGWALDGYQVIFQ